MFRVGFELRKRDWQKSHKVISKVCQEKRNLMIHDISEHPDLASPWADSYLTAAFAILPLILEHRVWAVVCISNLSRQQLMLLDNSAEELELVTAQLHQLAGLLLDKPAIQSAPAAPIPDDELALIANLMEKLDQTLDTNNVFITFNELISKHIALDFMAIIHDNLSDNQQGILCIRRPAHITDLNSVFDDLSRQWQRRHRRAPQMDIDQTTLFGEELLKREGKCPAELKLGRTETFPIFIDNDLFALVAIAAHDDVLCNRRSMRLFNILSHHLLLHVKKGLLMAQNQEMQTVDTLTGLYNERHFYHTMEREFDRAARYNVPLCLLIIDVDHFKDVNEAYGFETGDMLLREISRILMENMRSTDFVSRYSGERFIIVLPETHYKNAEIMGNRLRRFVENNSFYIPNTNVFIKVTVSIGVASYLDHKPTSLAQFIEFADTALYFAKRGGRNQVVGYSYVINMMMRDTESES
jgi:diguanylate cyclase (GGDEF)-like protein